MRQQFPLTTYRKAVAFYFALPPLKPLDFYLGEKPCYCLNHNTPVLLCYTSSIYLY